MTARIKDWTFVSALELKEINRGMVEYSQQIHIIFIEISSEKLFEVNRLYCLAVDVIAGK
jgi:hypothetical protein